VSSDAVVDTRSELLSLLTEACELEHGLACIYLYAAFSLKQELDEGITWEDQQVARRWAAQLYFVASQEMLHLSQAWNLLSAIGGTPYHARPNFPQGARSYPLGLPLELHPFAPDTIRRFIAFEEPEAQAAQRRAEERRQPSANARSDEEFTYRTVGELYSLIQSGFERIDARELFIGPRAHQVTPTLVHFPDIVDVHDRPSAIAAIEHIRTQGEGVRIDREDSHWGIFRRIGEEYDTLLTENSRSNLVRDVASNPVAHVRADQDPLTVAPITNPHSAQTAELFDQVYGLMLRMLAYVFAGSERSPMAAPFAEAAIELMVTCIKPLGESLTLLPLGKQNESARAGAPFALSRHIPLPAEAAVAWQLTIERLTELVDTAAALARTGRVAQLEAATDALQRITRKLINTRADFDR
jgi:hypothetical protein